MLYRIPSFLWLRRTIASIYVYCVVSVQYCDGFGYFSWLLSWYFSGYTPCAKAHGHGIKMRNGMGPTPQILKIAGLTAKDMRNTQILCLTPPHTLVKQPHPKQHLKTRIMTLRYQTHTPSAHERLA